MELFKYDTKLSVTTKLPLIFQGFLQCPFSVIRMHGRLADPELLCRFPHRGIGVYHEIRNLNRPFLDICFQTKHSFSIAWLCICPQMGIYPKNHHKDSPCTPDPPFLSL